MEQQNQQPSQENTESKPLVKTKTSTGSAGSPQASSARNWKLFAIVAIVAIIITVGGILLLRESPPVPVPVSEGKARISGKAVALSDVQTIPNTPLTVGIIGVIPEERFDSFVTEARGAGVAFLDQNIISSYVVNSSSFDAQGSFQFEVEAGLYVLCYFFPATSSEAMRLETCARTHLETGEQLPITIGKMFGTSITGRSLEAIPLTDIYPVTPSSSDTSDWQTYRSEEFGFEVKYPSDWTVNDNGNISLGNQSLDVAIIVWSDGSKAYAMEQWQSVPCAPGGDGGGGCAPLNNKETKTIEVDGNTVYWKIDGYDQMHAFIPNKLRNKTVEIYSVKLKDRDIFERVLSTFRFVEPLHEPPVGTTQLIGFFTAVWGDPPVGSGLPAVQQFQLTDDQNKTTQITITENTRFLEGQGALYFNNKTVKIMGGFNPDSYVFEATSLEIYKE